MKAQKAAVICMLAGCMAHTFSAAAAFGAAAAEAEPEVILAADTVASDADGHFTAAVSLEKLPEKGICAAEFQVAFDPAALRITKVDLQYDTGAQQAESRVHPDLEGTVFSYEIRENTVWVRFATALADPDFWLSEERVFFTLSGTLKEVFPTGTGTELRIVPAAGESEQSELTAGYLEDDGTAHYCQTLGRSGAVWRAIDETGATMYGDIDLDGTRSVADAVLMHRAIGEELALSAAAYANADCEFDGLLTLGDVTLMLRYLNQMAEDTALGAH